MNNFQYTSEYIAWFMHPMTVPFIRQFALYYTFCEFTMLYSSKYRQKNHQSVLEERKNNQVIWVYLQERTFLRLLVNEFIFK